MLAPPGQDDFAGWVRQLADSPRRPRAFQHLLLSGAPALPAVVDGLSSGAPEVRRWCTRLLDHLVDDASMPALVAMLDDPHPLVRVEALHALTCDRCKDDTCRPTPPAVLPRAIELLIADPDAHVRAYATGLVARWVHTDGAARDALVQARDHDRSPAVRKSAGWHAPGGAIHRRTAPRPERATARAGSR